MERKDLMKWHVDFTCSDDNDIYEQIIINLAIVEKAMSDPNFTNQNLEELKEIIHETKILSTAAVYRKEKENSNQFSDTIVHEYESWLKPSEKEEAFAAYKTSEGIHR